MRARGRSALLMAAVLAVPPLAATPAAIAGDEYVEAVLPRGEVPEEELLDVAIDLFSPSVDDTDREQLTKEGIQPSVRKSEARYLPIHLRNTLQSTGQWGAVRVVPGVAEWAELLVFGKILKSNGKDLEVAIRAWDAAGEMWLDEEYHHRASPQSYAEETVDRLDPFQSLYNRIANDLVEERGKRRRHELQRIREVARLRFAAEFAPDTFGPYLEADKKGRYRVLRLPAEGDPMLDRLALIRERDHLFVDTLNEYYSDFYARMDRPYDDWRGYSYAEQAAYDSLQKSSLVKKIIGGVAIVAGLLVPDERNTGVKDVAIIGGIAAIDSAMRDSEDSKIHKAALTELADSFGADVTPLLVDVDGKVTHLKGSAEAQFEQWRELLKRIALTDASLPGDINVAPMSAEVVVTPPPPSTGDPVPSPAEDSFLDGVDEDPLDETTPGNEETSSSAPSVSPFRNLAPLPADRSLAPPPAEPGNVPR